MQQSPDSPIKQRLRTVRRRITAATLATFLAAWLAVAALGKGGTTATPATTSASPSTGASSQSDDTTSASSGESSDSTGADDDSTQSDGSSAGQSTQNAPVTTAQS